MNAQAATWILDIVREIFAFLDKMIYGFIRWILIGIFDLSKVTANSEIFGDVARRIYVILGIFMAFKLFFSFFQYLINPDSMTSGDKSLGKIGLNVFIMLFAIMFLPRTLFGPESQGLALLPRAQKVLLDATPNIILGGKFVDSDENIENSAELIAVTTLRGFFRPAEDLDVQCKKDPDALKDTEELQINNLGEFKDRAIAKCNTDGPFTERAKLIINLKKGITSNLEDGSVYYKYTYLLGISTVVGLLLVVLLLAITLEVAKRVFKMILLELIAPIPIMSLIDPKSSKNGAFSHWIKCVFTTYLDLFIKLAILYFVLVLIAEITDGFINKDLLAIVPTGANSMRKAYLIIFLILGLLFFAKEAPKFIKDAIGLKDSGGGLFDDVKSIGKAAGIVGGAAVGAGAAVAGSLAAADRADENGHTGAALGALLSTPGAAIAGAIRGGTAGAKGASKGNTFAGLSSAYSSQAGANAKNSEFRAQGGSTLGAVGSSVRKALTGESSYEALEHDWKHEEEEIKTEEADLKPVQDANAHRKAIMDRASSKAKESDKTSGTYGGITGNYRSYNSTLEAAKSGVGLYQGYSAYKDSSGRVISNSAYNSLSDRDKANYTKSVMSQAEHTAALSSTDPTTAAAAANYTADGTYFSFNGQHVNMADAESIGMGLLDANTVDYYKQAYNTRDAETPFDQSIASSIELYEQCGQGKIEKEFGKLKASYGNTSTELNRKSNSINRRKQKLNASKQSRSTARKKANSSRYSAKK